MFKAKLRLFYGENFSFFISLAILIASCKIKRYENNSRQDFLRPKTILEINFQTN